MYERESKSVAGAGSRPSVFILDVDSEATVQNGAANGSRESYDGWIQLARALSSSPAWRQVPDATLVIRPGIRPMMAVLGRFDEAAKARVEALRWQLANVRPRLRYVSYQQAEESCEGLGTRLIERFGRQEVRSFGFRGVPRGGLIVLGMLAYRLDLRHSQLEPPHPPDRPLVIVDDCAITGVRFSRILMECKNPQVVFAHLYSHPDLRNAIQTRETRVLACLSAHDLFDHAPRKLGGDYPAWRETWLGRFGDSCYWIGQPDHLCFAWNEPDVTIWNPVTGEMEPGWRFGSPANCLKNQPLAGQSFLRLQVQPEGKGPLRPSAKVIFAEVEGQIVVADADTKESFALTDVAAGIWRAIVEHGDFEQAVSRLLANYEVEEPILRDHSRSLVDELLARGLLECSNA